MSTRQCRVAKKGLAVLVAAEHQKDIGAPDYTITNSVGVVTNTNTIDTKSIFSYNSLKSLPERITNNNQRYNIESSFSPIYNF